MGHDAVHREQSPLSLGREDVTEGDREWGPGASKSVGTATYRDAFVVRLKPILAMVTGRVETVTRQPVARLPGSLFRVVVGSAVRNATARWFEMTFGTWTVESELSCQRRNHPSSPLYNDHMYTRTASVWRHLSIGDIVLKYSSTPRRERSRSPGLTSRLFSGSPIFWHGDDRHGFVRPKGDAGGNADAQILSQRWHADRTRDKKAGLPRGVPFRG